MLSYVGAVWRCRYFWLSLVKMDLRTRYRRSVLGMGWSLLHPIAMTIVLCVVFHTAFGADGGIRQYAPYLLAGLACWSYIVNVTVLGCQSLFQGESYIRQYPAPLAIYPLRTALGGTVHFLIALLMVLLMSWFVNGFGNLPYLLFLLPTLLLLFVFVWSLAVLVAFANVFFTDTQHLCEVGFQILFYMTPILYPVSILRDRGLDWVVDWNPLVALLDLVRLPILHATAPPLASFAMALATVLVVGSAAVWTLARQQKQLVFHL
jgi:ABC-type polysaccharide/polyol phosphate export permease